MPELQATNSEPTTIMTRLASNLGVWGIPGRWTIGLLAAPLPVLPIAVFLAVKEKPWFYALTSEDHLVEWAQFAALLIAGGTYLVVTRRLWKMGPRYAAVFALLVALAALVIAGEEISWGQRLLGLETPRVLDAINEQDEITIHNIASLSRITRLVQFGATGYGLLLPLLMLLPGVPSRLRNSYFVPPVALVSFFLGPFILWTARILWLGASEAIHPVSEMMELSWYAGFALFGLLTVRRLNGELTRHVEGDTPDDSDGQLHRPA